MADPTVRELKLIQYLNEAYGKEKELETALQAHISMTTRKPYKKRLQDHLKETKAQARNLERRIKKLGGTPEALDLPGPDAVGRAAGAATSAAKKGAALAKGPLHALRGTSEAEKMLKNAKTEYWNEAEEIATYTGIEALADALGDKETSKLAKEHRRQEERMQKFLGTLIPQLTKAVVTEEIPAKDRKPAAAASSRSTSRSSSRSTASSARSTASSRSTAAKKAARTRTAAAKKRSAAASKAGKASAKKASGSAGRSTARRSTNNSGSSSGATTRRRATSRSSSN
jgi:ferritin-like metal-binding protein YciE